MSVILSIAVLAFVAYDFVLLSRMRNALNEAIAAQPKLEELFHAKPTSVGELTVDVKLDPRELARYVEGLMAREQANLSVAVDNRPPGIGPGGMVGPPGTVFDPRIAMFIPDPQARSKGPVGGR